MPFSVHRGDTRRSARLNALLVLIAAFLAVLPACREERADPVDSYLADLRRRCERLKPHVEKAIGRPLGEVEIVVASREQLTEIALPQLQESLARIENGPKGEVLEADARSAAEGLAYWYAAYVDRKGRILFPDPNEEREGLLAFFIELMPRPEVAEDPRRPDLILLHELVHVHQHRHLESPAFLESVRSRADILARRAVLEGHAEHLAHKIASTIGLGELYEEYYRARTEPSPRAKGFARFEGRVVAADLLFAHRQGRDFVDFVVERLGYEGAIRRIFQSPPSLRAVSRPEEYFRPSEPSRWGPILEDLRRWLVRERGEGSIEAVALPMVRELAGEAAEAFREGFQLEVDVADVVVHVLIAGSGKGARKLHRGWTAGLERLHALRVETGFCEAIRRRRGPDDWMLHYTWPNETHWRRTAVRRGPLIVDVECRPDSEVEKGAERLARRAMEFLSNEPWREAWLEGGQELLESGDAGLRLAAVSRMERFILDEDWEVRWLGRWFEARDEERSEEERIAILAKAMEDSHPAVVARGLRAVRDLDLGEVPWPLLRRRLGHREAAVRREAWGLVAFRIGGEEHSNEALRLVTGALDDHDVTVRVGAVECLTEFEPQPALLPVFRKALRDEHSRVRGNALVTLAVYPFGFPELVPDLIALLEEDPGNAAKALSDLGDAAREALPHLRKALENPDGRADVAEAIWLLAADPEPLFTVVRESVAEGGAQGIEALGGVGATARPLVPEVAKVLAHDSRWVRIRAAKALGRIGGPQAERALGARLEVERDEKVIESLRKALGEKEEQAGDG